MKKRNGFVSNSSSSSFIIGSKTELTEENLLDLARIEKGSPFEDLFKEIVSAVASRLGEPWKTADEYVKNFGEIDKTTKELFAKGFFVYTGSFSDEGDGAEKMLCDISWKYKGDDLVIEHEGGY